MPAQPYWPIRSEICFSTAVSAHALRACQTKETVKIHPTLFLVGSGHEIIECKLFKDIDSDGDRPKLAALLATGEELAHLATMEN